MTPLALILLLLVVATILLFAELVLPTHGLLGVLAGIAGLGAVGVCFYLNRWLGLGVFAASVLLLPLLLAGLIQGWQHSPVGRRVTLNATTGVAVGRDLRVSVGDVGRCVSALRPMGECEFVVKPTDFPTDQPDDFSPAAERLIQCVSEIGPIAAGAAVKVVAFRDGVATVRQV